MAYCRECGAVLEEGGRFCPECGAPVENTAKRLEASTARPRKAKKPLLRRWWFWLLVIAAAGSLYGRGGSGSTRATTPKPVATVTVTPRPTAKPTPVPTAKPSPKPTASPSPSPSPTPKPEPTAPALSEDTIRPEVKEFLDSYEACMNEYVDFMKKYMNADPGNMIAMMGDYYSVLARYLEFTDKLDALDEDELTTAELAYYLEVTGRVSQKLLTVAGY